jgi:hypothetical protein
MSDDFVLAELQALRDADRYLEAPPELEAKLMEAYRRHNALRTWRRIAPLFAVAAIVAWMAFVPRMHSRAASVPTAVETPLSLARTWRTLQRTTEALSPQTPPRIETTSVRTLKGAPRSTRLLAAKAVEVSEVATEFFPLIDTPPPFERGELMRVIVPAATMRKVGLPVSDNHLDDPVQADILVGQEGLARAIRFVDPRK